MKASVCFRNFEERDIDFIYHCKNDEKLNSMIVGQFHPFSYEQAAKWVHGCMGEHENFKFWAIASNDQEKRIVGWVALSNIDLDNNSACFHSIVIGDKGYRDGMAWIESYLFVLDYAFNVIKLHRIYGSNLTEHKQSGVVAHAMFMEDEGIQKDAIFKNGKFNNILLYAILREDYLKYYDEGLYEENKIIERILKKLKK